jgi:hypothetical protein
MYRLSICLITLATLLISESWAAPPHGHGGGSSGSFGFSIGGSSGVGIGVGVGNNSYHNNYNYGYGNRGYYDRDYYGRGYNGGWYGGSGMYFGGGSHDFRWGVGIPFGYDDYDWYAPYYNNYSYYNNNAPGNYQGSDYYSEIYSAPTAQQPPAMEHPPIPTAGQVARLTDEQLRMMIAVSLDNYIKNILSWPN